MRERRHRQTTALLIGLSVISVLWAIGALSRKHVEMDKNSDLEASVDQLMKSNGAITHELKLTKNILADIKRENLQLKKEREELTAAVNTLSAELRQEKQAAEREQSAYKKQRGQLRKKFSQVQTANIELGQELAAARETIQLLERRLNELNNAAIPPRSRQNTATEESDEASLPLKNYQW